MYACKIRRSPLPRDLVNLPFTFSSLKTTCSCDRPVLMQPASSRRAINVGGSTFLTKSGVKALSPSEPAKSTTIRYEVMRPPWPSSCSTLVQNATCPRDDSGFLPVGAKWLASCAWLMRSQHACSVLTPRDVHCFGSRPPEPFFSAQSFDTFSAANKSKSSMRDTCVPYASQPDTDNCFTDSLFKSSSSMNGSTPFTPCSGLPTNVCVFPEPVCPYAINTALKPSNTLRTNGLPMIR
mmetsp:Transcript_43494/g.71829  ORF Transcript_43494/g.71829 Transcript_43494/m.71829 type:complete len:237 (-) Transcript_43494:282-992(-)